MYEIFLIIPKGKTIDYNNLKENCLHLEKMTKIIFNNSKNYLLKKRKQKITSKTEIHNRMKKQILSATYRTKHKKLPTNTYSRKNVTQM